MNTAAATGVADGGPTAADTAATPTPTGQADTTGTSGSSGAGMDDGMSDAAFLGSADDGLRPLSCEVYEQDCPEGDKCVPWSNDGGTWNATRCRPIPPDPNEVGEPCFVEGDGVSGIDSCNLGQMCWDVEPETGEGICTALCGNDKANPVCQDPSTQCTVLVEGVLPLCLLKCDPLFSDCGDLSHTCVPTAAGFSCVPLPRSGGAAHGSQCEYVNDCGVGLFCLAGAVAGCDGPGCCATVCDLSVGDPDEQCPGFVAGESCVAWFEEGGGFGPNYDIGVCAL